MTASKRPSALTCRATSLAPGDRLEIADHHGFGAGQRAFCVLAARAIAGVEDDGMALFDQQLARHQAEPCR